MKNLFTLLLFLTVSSYSQSTESLKTGIKKYYQANYLLDFETIVSLSYAKMVETIGRDEFLKKVESHYENDEYRLRFQLENVPFKFGEIKKIENKSFCVITCRNPIRYTFETKLTPETVTQKAAFLKEINKTKEVIFEPKRNSFNVSKTSVIVAIFDENTKEKWQFYNLDEATQYNYFITFFGESTKKELGL